jgi:proteic killer suppression protein
MILRFRHKGLERLFTRGDASGVNPQLAAKLRRILALLDESSDPSAVNMPGYRLHQFKGGREGQWSATISANWRLVFEFEHGNATNVDLVDYH